jgi:hypothetical protein
MKKIRKLSALLGLAVMCAARAEAQGLIGAGPVQPVSDVCDDWQPLYPDTQTGAAIVALFLPFSPINLVYVGSDNAAENTAVIYNAASSAVKDLTDPGEVCWSANVNYISSSTQALVYKLPLTCYKNAFCRNVIAGQPPQKVIEADNNRRRVL